MLLLNFKLVLSAMLNALPPLPAAALGAPSTCSFQVMDAIDTHIDVSAQKHIMRALGSADASAATQGLGMLAAVKSGALAGVFEPARGPVVERGKRMSPGNPTPWWTMIPKGELATCLTEPANEAPMLLYKSNLQPAQITAALVEAWPQCGLPLESACFDEAIKLASIKKQPLEAQVWRGLTTLNAAGHLDALIAAHDAGRTAPSSAKAVERWIGIKPGDAKWRSSLVTLKARMEANQTQVSVTVKMPPETDSWPGCRDHGYFGEFKNGTIYMCENATRSDICLSNVLTHEYFHSVGMPAEGKGAERDGVCTPSTDLDTAMKTSACLAGLACELTWGQGAHCSSPC